MAYWFLRIFSACFLFAQVAAGQSVRYTGSVGSAPIELTLMESVDGDIRGVYAYTRFGTPIELSGTLKQGVLRLTERNSLGKNSANLTIMAFAATNETAAGTWKNLATGRQLPLVLTQLPQGGKEPRTASGGHELLQVASLPNTYFKIVLAGNPDDYNGQVTAVRLVEKRTNRLVQELAVVSQSHGLNTVQVGDYNFDGHPDFEVFESSYAGPNTSSFYFLYNPLTKRYVDSGFTGTSLEFDARSKWITETNSCCAGSSVTKAEYKVVRNRMVLVAEHCYRWDDKKQELVERKLSACR